MHGLHIVFSCWLLSYGIFICGYIFRPAQSSSDFIVPQDSMRTCFFICWSTYFEFAHFCLFSPQAFFWHRHQSVYNTWVRSTICRHQPRRWWFWAHCVDLVKYLYARKWLVVATAVSCLHSSEILWGRSHRRPHNQIFVGVPQTVTGLAPVVSSDLRKRFWLLLPYCCFAGDTLQL